jgi:hypothetical protein
VEGHVGIREVRVCTKKKQKNTTPLCHGVAASQLPLTPQPGVTPDPTAPATEATGPKAVGGEEPPAPPEP